VKRPGRWMVGRSLAHVVAAAAFCATIGIGQAGDPTAVRGATPDLTLVADARYEVLPAEGRVAVTVDIVATNHLVDTEANLYFFEQAYLAVQPGASDFRLSSPDARPVVSVAATEPTHTLLLLRFGRRLAAGASASLRLEFDLVDAGTPPDRDVRVSDTLVTFSAWAFASDSTPGSSVTVGLPPGYDVTFLRGTLAGPVPDVVGRNTWASGPLDEPTTFETAIRATRAAEYIDSNRSTAVDGATARIRFRAWRDDPGWLGETSRLVLDGVPALARAIGRPWPLTETLLVEEGLVAEASDSAGLFDPRAPRIEIAYYAGPEVVLHEVAHAWFNGSRLEDRWSNEAFASLYAELAAASIGEPIASPELTDELRPARVPLNAWGPAGSTATATDGYGYAASLKLARAILARAGPAGLTAVWTAIDEGHAAYLASEAEAAAGPADWRRLLDLLEEHTSASYADLWLTYVVRPDDVGLIHDRARARAAYTALVAEAADWPIPTTISDALRAWRFDLADAAIASARATLADRDRLRTEAIAASVALPATLSARFERGQLDAAATELAAARLALAEIVIATAREPASADAVEWLGLLGSDPGHGLATARSALAAGDLATAFDLAVEAEAAWRSAADIGRGRIAGALIGLLAAILLVRLITSRGWARQVGWS